MRTIDGIRYVSARELADIKGISISRVSQIKSELPFVKFEEFGLELVNLELVELTAQQELMAKQKFQTTTLIHELSYKDLGNYFGKFVMDLVSFKGSADLKMDEMQAKINCLQQKNEAAEAERDSLRTQITGMDLVIQGQATDCVRYVEQNAQLSVMNETLSENNEQLIANRAQLANELGAVQAVCNDSKHNLEIKIVENKALLTENESLKLRLAQLEESARQDANYRQELSELTSYVKKYVKLV